MSDQGMMHTIMKIVPYEGGVRLDVDVRAVAKIDYLIIGERRVQEQRAFECSGMMVAMLRKAAMPLGKFFLGQGRVNPRADVEFDTESNRFVVKGVAAYSYIFEKGLGLQCPKCGNRTLVQGYGMAGGGMGPYEYCETDGCDYFEKTQDPEMFTPSAAQPDLPAAGGRASQPGGPQPPAKDPSRSP